MIKLIFARSINGTIGKDGKLPWDLPEDLQLFKTKTTGHIVLMGRATWESLPNTFRPLPGRINVVLSRNPKQFGEEYFPDAVVSTVDGSPETFKSVLEALQLKYPDKDIWVIGGRSVFEQALPYADEIHETLIDKEFEGDQSVFDPAQLREFSKSVGPGATPSWWHSPKGNLAFRVNLYTRLAPHAVLGRKPWDI